MSVTDRLSRQVDFLLEIDRLKGVLRQTFLTDGSRRENSAEHSWHVAIFAAVLLEHAARPDLDLLRVIKMLLIHDVVEIDAGDTFVYDEAAHADKAERERRAADRLFGLLPPDQARELRELWDEYEARATPEARYAAALDRLQPILHNLRTQGTVWRKHGIRSSQVLARNRHMVEGSPALWEYAQARIREAVERGYLEE